MAQFTYILNVLTICARSWDSKASFKSWKCAQFSSRILKYHFVFVYLRCPRCCVVTIFSSENLKVGSRNGLKRWEIFDLLMVYFLFFAENILPTQHLGHLYLQIQNNSSRLYSTNCTYSTYIEYTYIQVKLCQEGNIAL